ASLTARKIICLSYKVNNAASAYVLAREEWMPIAVERAVACENVLGEGCYWDAARERLWWIDVPMPSQLHALAPATGKVETTPMPEMITAVRAKRDGSGLIVACHSGISSFDFETGAL